VCAKRGVRRTHILRVRSPRAGPKLSAVGTSTVAQVRSVRFEMLIRACIHLWHRLTLSVCSCCLLLCSIGCSQPSFRRRAARSPVGSTASGCSMTLVKVGIVLGDDRAMTEAR
jgi:hypothetical protein